MLDYHKMIEAMNIFLAYPDSEASAVVCDGKLLAGPHPSIVSVADRKKLFSLNWLVDPAHECFEYWDGPDFVYNEPKIETGIPCFNCKKQSGLDCAGREKDEATLCDECLQVRMTEERRLQREHLFPYLDDENLDLEEVRCVQECLKQCED